MAPVPVPPAQTDMLIELIQAKQRADIIIGHKAKQAAADAYQAWFEFAHWAEVLSVVCTASGPALAGHMAQYNNTDLIFNFS